MILSVYANTKTTEAVEVDGSFEILSVTKRNGRIKIIDTNTENIYWLDVKDVAILNAEEDEVEETKSVEEVIEEPVKEEIKVEPVVKKTKKKVEEKVEEEKPVTNKKPIFYNVKRGDTLTSIVNSLGLTFLQVFELNPTLGHGIVIGQKILIGFEEE